MTVYCVCVYAAASVLAMGIDMAPDGAVEWLRGPFIFITGVIAGLALTLA